MARLKYVPLEELLTMMENNDKFKLVEALSEEAYREGHIPGAVNVPVERATEEAGRKLKKSDKIVVYCASYTCHASTKLARQLMKLGYKKVMDFKAGKKGWTDAGLELEKA